MGNGLELVNTDHLKRYEHRSGEENPRKLAPAHAESLLFQHCLAHDLKGIFLESEANFY